MTKQVRIELEPGLLRFARGFLGATSETEAEIAIRALVAKYLAHWLTVDGASTVWWESGALRGRYDLKARVLNGQLILSSPDLALSLSLNPIRSGRVIRVLGVTVNESLLDEPRHGFDPLGYGWRRKRRGWLRPGVETVTWDFVRGGRHFVLLAWRPPRKRRRWLASFSGLYTAGESVMLTPGSDEAMTALGDSRVRPLRGMRGKVKLPVDTMVPLRESDESFGTLREAFEALIELLPGADMAEGKHRKPRSHL